MRKMKIQSWIAYLKYFFFYLFLISIPWQKRHIFSDLPLGGAFNEWTSISLYVSDILLGLTLFFWLAEYLLDREAGIRKREVGIRNYELRFAIYGLLIALLVWSSLSLLNVQEFKIAFYRLMKLLEVIILFLFIIYNLKLRKYRILAYFNLIFSGVIQSIIALGQYISQHSLGLKILGEVDLAPDIIGVAKIVVGGEKIIRSYGTFPHPNVLGGFLILIILLSLYLYLDLKRFFSPRLKKIISIFLLFVTPLFLLCLILTFSRTAWFGFLLILGGWIFFVFQKKYLLSSFLVLTLVLITIIFSFIFLAPQISTRTKIIDSPAGDLALSNRLFLNRIAFSIIAQKPWRGGGLGNFVFYLSRLINFNLPAWRLQPVHNIYLAIASEIGIPGLLLFLALLWFTIYYGMKSRKNNMEVWCLELIFISYLLIGFFDHYFYDLQQGALIFWLVLSTIWSIILSPSFSVSLYKDN